MTSIKLKFRASAKYEKEGTLYYQLIHERVVRQIKTDYRLFCWEWDMKNNSIINPDIKSPRYKHVKLILQKVNMDIQKMLNVIHGLSFCSHSYSIDEIIKAYLNYSMIQCSFFDYARKKIEILKKSGNIVTANNHEVTLNSFMSYYGKKDLDITKMNVEMINGYEVFLKSRGNCRNTTSFYMRSLRSIYNQAIEDSLLEPQNIFKHVYTGIDKTMKRAIPMKDLRRIKELDLTTYPSLRLARDLFIFSFYTRGMSFIDLAYLRKTDIKGGILIYRRHKTGQQLAVRWEEEMQMIVNKYPNSTQYLLPIITREDGTEYAQYKNAMILINRKLKKISKLAGISESLSMYTSRHSWATIARNKNIPLSVISKGLGHGSDLNTQIYLASIETSEVDKANRKILQDLRENY